MSSEKFYADHEGFDTVLAWKELTLVSWLH
jgi:hypothetical protein